jgi:excisionase family DNA binding protein
MENKDKKTMFISVAELANKLNISRIAVFKKIKKGQILAHKVGRSYVISVDDVANFSHSSNPEILTEDTKGEMEKAVKKVVDEYGETLKLLGKE